MEAETKKLHSNAIESKPNVVKPILKVTKTKPSKKKKVPEDPKMLAVISDIV